MVITTTMRLKKQLEKTMSNQEEIDAIRENGGMGNEN